MPLKSENKNFTDLDFDSNKNSLKAYLANQTRFKDYDFEGSNMSVLLDILSYNTLLNSHYNNMAIAESFLDTAKLKESVVSHAKELNYLPRSETSARATVRIILSVASGSPAFVTVPAKTKFTARCGNSTYLFTNKDSSIIERDVNGDYILDSLDIYEGTWKTQFFKVNGAPNQRFIIDDPLIDVNSLEVQILESESVNSVATEFIMKSSLFGVTEESNVFYIQAFRDDNYELTFGGGVFGKSPESGNLIKVSYRRTAGGAANNIDSFGAATSIGGYSATVETVMNSGGGSDREGIDSIKIFAPKSIQIQDRAVTESDYEILLKRKFPEIQAVSVYGGEKAVPPQYGRVIISIDLNNKMGISDIDKRKFVDYLRDVSVIAIEPVIVSTDFMYVRVVSNVYYDMKSTNRSSSDVKASVLDAISNYSLTKLSDFRKSVRYSKLINEIDLADEAIISNDTKIEAIIEFTPIPNKSESRVINFGNKLDKVADAGAIRSSVFTYNGVSSFMMDDGDGNIDIVSDNDDSIIFIKRAIGSVEYETGKVLINQLAVDSFFGSAIKIYANVESKDIIGPADRIISIRDQDIAVSVIKQ